MKVNELMIGDWVTIKSNGKVPDVNAQIASLDLDNEITVDHMVCDNLLREDELLPIPLTEEILKANGFVKDNNGRFCHHSMNCNDGSSISIDIESGTNGFDHGHIEFDYAELIYSCEYVHELQHFIRICGLTELADNFKVV